MCDVGGSRVSLSATPVSPGPPACHLFPSTPRYAAYVRMLTDRRAALETEEQAVAKADRYDNMCVFTRRPQSAHCHAHTRSGHSSRAPPKQKPKWRFFLCVFPDGCAWGHRPGMRTRRWRSSSRRPRPSRRSPRPRPGASRWRVRWAAACSARTAVAPTRASTAAWSATCSRATPRIRCGTDTLATPCHLF